MTNPQGTTPSDVGGGRRRTSGRWSAKQARERPIDWSAIRDRVDLPDVARRLMGAPHGRKGEGGKRLWWRCPFHPDNNPSLCVEPGRPHWRCFGCGEHGDALALVMKYQRVPFREALAFVACDVRHGAIATPSQGPRPKPEPDDSRSIGPNREGRTLVDWPAKRLWTPEGRQALDDLRGRGLNDQTIRLARLGYTPWVKECRFHGITIPWFGPEGLELVKIRQPDGCEPRYAEVYRRQPTVYPGPPLAILPHVGPVVVVEGELDALLLGQELDGLAVVITLGSASSRPTPGLLNLLSSASRLLLATDGDAAGDRAATGWGERARRVRPPEPHKDWTEAHRAGVKLRWWWVPRLVADPHDAEERAAIMEHDGGLSREAAERAAADAPAATGLGVPLGVLDESEEAWLGRIKPGPQPDGGYVWIEY